MLTLNIHFFCLRVNSWPAESPHIALWKPRARSAKRTTRSFNSMGWTPKMNIYNGIRGMGRGLGEALREWGILGWQRRVGLSLGKEHILRQAALRGLSYLSMWESPSCSVYKVFASTLNRHTLFASYPKSVSSYAHGHHHVSPPALGRLRIERVWNLRPSLGAVKTGC